MWIYRKSEPGLWTVGYKDTNTGEWHSDSDHDDREDAAARVNFLNGGFGLRHDKCAPKPDKAEDCPHGNKAHDCDACNTESDFQHDCDQERRHFGGRGPF